MILHFFLLDELSAVTGMGALWRSAGCGRQISTSPLACSRAITSSASILVAGVKGSLPKPFDQLQPSAVIGIFDAATSMTIVPLRKFVLPRLFSWERPRQSGFLPGRGIQALNGDAAAPLDAEAALEVDV